VNESLSLSPNLSAGLHGVDVPMGVTDNVDDSGDGRGTTDRNQGPRVNGVDSGIRTNLGRNGIGSGRMNESLSLSPHLSTGLHGVDVPMGVTDNVDSSGNGRGTTDRNQNPRVNVVDGGDRTDLGSSGCRINQDHSGDGSGTLPGLIGSSLRNNQDHNGGGSGTLSDLDPSGNGSESQHGALDGDRTVRKDGDTSNGFGSGNQYTGNPHQPNPPVGGVLSPCLMTFRL
jgi:hypothetical protein